MSDALEGLSGGPGVAAAVGADVDLAGRIRDLLGLLAKTVRARQVYEANNPVYERFLASLRSGFAEVWAYTSSLHFQVEESGFRREGETYPVGEGRDNVAFEFFKDGIRYLTFLPGFEDELERFLEVILRARRMRSDEDDLVTLLWEQDFHAFRYGYVDVLATGLELPAASAAAYERPVPAAAEEAMAPAGVSGEAAAPEAAPVSREAFNETLYFLDPDEVARLRAELDDEWSRDPRPAVLNALFDRLEDGSPARQEEILGILRQLLPAFLARGELKAVAQVLHELEVLLAHGGGLTGDRRARAEALFDELNDPAVLEQLLQALQDGGIDPRSDDLGLFLSRLRPSALPVLLRASETSESAVVRERVRPACDHLARRHPEALVALLGAKDDALAIGAARAVGRLRIAAGTHGLIRLLRRRSPATRLAAVEALIAVRSAAAMEGLKRALEDTTREVRIAAARGLASLRYAPARGALQKRIESRDLRRADVTEMLAYFEAYADVGGGEAVAVLDRLLNGRGRFGRRQPAQLRACAATALGRIATPAARSCLERAATETDAIVRGAVMRALRREAPVP